MLLAPGGRRVYDTNAGARSLAPCICLGRPVDFLLPVVGVLPCRLFFFECRAQEGTPDVEELFGHRWIKSEEIKQARRIIILLYCH